MKDFSNKYIIIGAGPTGLVHARAFKEKNILYDQIEATDDVGGNWYHGTYSTAHIISSKKVTEFPEWKMPENYPDFPSRKNMYDYFVGYCKHFNLRENIEFNTKVIWVRPIENNLWEITLDNFEKRIYKGVLVCNGHHWDKRFPKYEGNFLGEFIHSKDYKHPDQLKNKKVIVVGGGNSACDVASEAARVGAKSFLSMRNGVWFLPKTFMGKPLTDLGGALQMPLFLQRLMVKFILKLTQGKYSQYNLPQPNHKIFEKHPTLSNEVLHYIKHGRIIPKPAIKKLNGHQVEFSDGTTETADMIVCATGYHLSYPFLPQELHRVEGPIAKVYGGSMLEDYNGLYLVAWAQARGGIGSVISPAADLLTKMILLQEKINVPIGLVLKELGDKKPDTHLFDPQQVLKRIKRAHRFYHFVEKRALKIEKKYPNFKNKTIETPQKLNPELIVN